eukprot:GHVL01002473.1.p1 GENE.GHVL01002473.1~~GHVL01002473.1.p1  ORF type:complete len:476 (-),score=137.01 GHVL01002473.1:207-1634(-)
MFATINRVANTRHIYKNIYNLCRYQTSIVTKYVETIGCPKEITKNEFRVSQSPDTVKLLTNKGFKVKIENDAGKNASFTNDAYKNAGAEIVDILDINKCDIITKVRPPTIHEINLYNNNSILYSFIYPTINTDIVNKLINKNITSFGIECVPRISRAQVFDALSSMANIAGYKAVILAASHFKRFFTGQITAAGRVPPAKVLVIGGGVAGLSAVATAKNLGAIVRCFDTRPAVKEQVESLGGKFLELDGFKLEEGSGGYAKIMSDDFIKAEMELFKQQAKDVDIIITTALIPGKPAPKLILKEHVDLMKNGSVIVDLAAETGGNVETTKCGEVYIYNNITHIGYTDLPSMLPTQSSTLYSNNITKLLLSMINEKKNIKNDEKKNDKKKSLLNNTNIDYECININQLPKGFLGNINIYKSGKVSLNIGTHIYTVDGGCDCGFAQEGGIIFDQKELIMIGSVLRKLVITPDIDLSQL